MDKSTQEYQDTLAGAAEEYRAVYEKYRTLLAGLYARMYQGRSLQKLGHTAEALKCYEELLGQPTEHREFRDLHAKVLVAGDRLLAGGFAKELRPNRAARKCLAGQSSSG